MSTPSAERKTVRTSTPVKAAFESNASFKECVKTFNQAYSQGAVPDALTFEMLLHAAARDSKALPSNKRTPFLGIDMLREGIDEVSECMAECGVPRTASFTNAVIEALIDRGDHEGALLLGNAYALDQDGWKLQLMAACEASGEGRVAAELLQTMQNMRRLEQQQRFDALFKQAANACSNHKTARPGNVWAYFQIMQSIRRPNNWRKGLPWEDQKHDGKAALIFSGRSFDVALNIVRLCHDLRMTPWMRTEIHGVIMQLLRCHVLPAMHTNENRTVEAPAAAETARGKLKKLLSEMMTVMINTGDLHATTELIYALPPKYIPHSRMNRVLLLLLDDHLVAESKQFFDFFTSLEDRIQIYTHAFPQLHALARRAGDAEWEAKIAAVEKEELVKWETSRKKTEAQPDPH